MPETLTIVETAGLPDASGSAAGQGITCTGLCRASDGGWWIGKHPFSNPADASGVPGFVKVSADFSTVLVDASTSDFGASTSIQGVALDTTDNTLWIPLASSIRHFLEDGTRIVDDVITCSPAGSGICYDAENDFLYLINGSGDFQTYDPNTFAKVADLEPFPAASADHLAMVNGKVWCAAGANGSDGTIWEYDPVLDTWTHLYTLSGADAIEGISVVYNKLRVCNDGYFHAGDGADPPLNRILIYDIPGFDPAPALSGKRSRAHVARILAATHN